MFKNGKKALAILIVLIFALSLMPAVAFASPPIGSEEPDIQAIIMSADGIDTVIHVDCVTNAEHEGSYALEDGYYSFDYTSNGAGIGKITVTLTETEAVIEHYIGLFSDNYGKHTFENCNYSFDIVGQGGGWKVQGNDGITINVSCEEEEDPEATQYYDITVNYVDENGDPIADPYKLLGIEEDSTYNVSDESAKEIEGYTRGSVDGELSGTLSGNVVITVHYTTNTPEDPEATQYYDITVNYVDENGDPIADPYKLLGIEEDSTYNVSDESAKEIEGYTRGSVDGELSGTLSGNVVITVHYTTNTQSPEPPTGPGPSSYSDKFDIIVTYVDEDGNAIADPYETTKTEGTSYDVSDYDAIAIDGYTYDFTDGSLSGQLHSNVVVIVHYTTNDATIDDGSVPGGSAPGDGDLGGDTDIGNGEVPGAELPAGGYVTVTPSGNLPQTGTVAVPVNPLWTLGTIAVLLSMSAVGLILFSSKKED